MARITMKLQGGKELNRAIKRAGDRGIPAIASALFIEAEGIMAKSKPEVPTDEAILRASGFVEKPKISGRLVKVELGYGGAAKGYAVLVHEGTGPAVGKAPFMPPVDAFRGWARRVLGDESLAFVVARSVGQKGTKARKYLEGPLRKATHGMALRLAIRVRRFLER